jgi:serine/threonine-protein kinase
MGRLTAEHVAERAIDAGLATPRQLQEVWGALGTRSVGVDEFLQALVRRELLTKYQVDRLLKGEKTGYFFGDYKILYLMGTGTFARVFRASHRETGQVVAIKALRSRFSGNPAQYGLFLREGELGRSLRHPNIVPIHEVHSRGREHYLVMEFVEGRTLREFVKVRKNLDPKDATRLMADVARGLDYAFQRSVTHRDLKMSNVLISSRGEAKLVDFGLAAIDEDTLAGAEGDASAARTVDYAALERATGVRRDDARSDIFFAGCIYYHMLSGTPPLYEGRDRTQRLSRSRFQEIVPIQQALPSLPLFVTFVVNRAMALDPSRRYQTPGELLADVESTMKRLDKSAPAGDPGEAAELGQDSRAGGAGQPERRVMVVEANLPMQNLLREGLKNAGYRVFLTSDPQRAFDRMAEEPGFADCVLFDAQEIGEPALDWFNRLPAYSWARALPALLLLGETQRSWSAKAQTSDRRRVLPLPITMKQLRATLEELLPGGHPRERGAAP